MTPLAATPSIPPTIGRTVLICRGLNASGKVATCGEAITHFVYRPAIVVVVHPGGAVNLVTFNNSLGPRYDRDGIETVRFEAGIPYSLEPQRMTWCWPTHVEPSRLDGQSFAASQQPFPIAAVASTPGTDAGTSVKSPQPTGSAQASGGDGEVSLIHADTAAS